MQQLEQISSRQNSLVKDLRRFAAHKRDRLDAGVVLSEGDHLLSAMLDAGLKPSVVAVAARVRGETKIQALLAASTPARCVVLDDAIFDQIAPTDSPAGLLTLSPLPQPDVAPDTMADTLILESVQDPGNVGSLIRTSVAAGIRQILLSPGCADVWSPRCLRAAQGAQWLAQIHADHSVGGFLKAYRGDIAATVLEGGQSLYKDSLLAPTAWLFGHEGQGLSAPLAAMATRCVTIPMPGGMESLNVNAAAAICLFEQVRQRAAR